MSEGQQVAACIAGYIVVAVIVGNAASAMGWDKDFITYPPPALVGALWPIAIVFGTVYAVASLVAWGFDKSLAPGRYLASLRFKCECGRRVKGQFCSACGRERKG
jgi:hypothetical protein